MMTSYFAMGRLTRYKVVVVGAPGVGKTCLVRTWARHPFLDRYIPNSLVWVHRVWMGMEAELIIYDVGGTRPPPYIVEILSKADAVVLMYDYSRMDETLGVLDKDWIPLVTALVKASALFLLVACNVPVDPVSNRLLPPPEKVEAWWQGVTRTNPRAIMSFWSVYHMRDYSEVSLLHLYNLIRQSQGEHHS